MAFIINSKFNFSYYNIRSLVSVWFRQAQPTLPEPVGGELVQLMKEVYCLIPVIQNNFKNQCAQIPSF